MFISLILLCGLAVDLTIILAFNWLNNWYDFWILLVGYLVGMIIGVLIIGISILIGALMYKKDKVYEKESKFHHRMVMRSCEFMLQFFRVKVLIRGLDKLSPDKPVLITPNHQAIFDSIALLWTLRAYPNAFVIKDSLSKAPFMGAFVNRSGFMGIDRNNARDGVRVINKAAQKIANENTTVVICPEGTRSKCAKMNDFHHGSFKIALKAKCDIVLCAIQNAYIVKKRWPWKSTNVYLDLVDVMKYDDFKDKNTQEISDYAHKVIEEDLETLPKYE